MDSIHAVLGSGWFLGVWGVSVATALFVAVEDLRRRNSHLMPLMKIVWILTTLYAGLVGLAAYVNTGRKEISDDGLWRKAVRSTAHCFSGCGAGEVLGVFLAIGILSLDVGWAGLVTFVMAYVFGLALTIGPLVQGGMSWSRAVRDALVSESASIFVMELVAIVADLWLGAGASMAEPRFWSSLSLSLTMGFLAAIPVNAWLITQGIKEGMHDPRHVAHAH